MCNATCGVGRGFDDDVERLRNHEVSLRAAMLNSSLGRSVLEPAGAIGLPVAGLGHRFRGVPRDHRR
jgi:hypothetical protein